MIWLESLFVLVLFLFIFLIVVAGAVAFRSPDWATAFQEAEIDEIYRRGLLNRRRSLQDERAIDAMVSELAEGGEMTAWELTLLSVLADEPDYERLSAELDAIRAELLSRMLERQRERVRRIGTLRYASKIWVAQKFASRAEVAARGTIWLFRRTWKLCVAIFSPWSVHASVVAVILGAFYWQFTRNNSAATPDLVAVVSNIATVAGLVAVSVVIVIVFYRVIIAFCGPPNSWSRRDIKVVALCVALSAALYGLLDFVYKHAHEWQLSEKSSTWLGNPDQLKIRTFCAGAMVFLAWRIPRWSADASINTSVSVTE